MTIIQTIKNAQTQIIIRKVIISNPNLSRALYAGPPGEIPKTLQNKTAISFRYDRDKQRLIIRVGT